MDIRRQLVPEMVQIGKARGRCGVEHDDQSLASVAGEKMGHAMPGDDLIGRILRVDRPVVGTLSGYLGGDPSVRQTGVARVQLLARGQTGQKRRRRLRAGKHHRDEFRRNPSAFVGERRGRAAAAKRIGLVINAQFRRHVDLNVLGQPDGPALARRVADVLTWSRICL